MADAQLQPQEILERHRGDLLGQALSVVGNREDAEDVVQETFCDALRNEQRLATAESVTGWLRSLNKCNALNRLRTRQRVQNKSQRRQQLAPEQLFTTGGFSLLELRDSVSKALERLSPEVRSIVELRYWNHLSCKDIAARMQMPEGTVKRTLFEANNALYDVLEQQLPLPPDPRHNLDSVTTFLGDKK